MKKQKEFILRNYLIAVLRRASYRYAARGAVLNLARRGRGIYKCAQCGRLIKRGELAVDHKTPVIPLTGFTTWDEYILRLFCGPEGLQVLCKDPCHKAKTKKENTLRRFHKKQKSRAEEKRK